MSIGHIIPVDPLKGATTTDSLFFRYLTVIFFDETKGFVIAIESGSGIVLALQSDSLKNEACLREDLLRVYGDTEELFVSIGIGNDRFPVKKENFLISSDPTDTRLDENAFPNVLQVNNGSYRLVTVWEEPAVAVIMKHDTYGVLRNEAAQEVLFQLDGDAPDGYRLSNESDGFRSGIKIGIP